jgi:septal ring factor EnvC (AmiA/AmiB activator)
MLKGCYPGAVRIVLLAVLSAIFLLPFPAASARDPRQPKSKYYNVKKKLGKAEKELRKIKKAEKVTLREIEKTSRQLSSVKKKHRKRKAKMDQALREMESAQADVKELEKKIESSKAWVRKKLRTMHKHGKYGDAILLMGTARDLSNFILRWSYLEKMAGYEQRAIESFRDSIRELRVKKARQERAYSTYRAEEERVRVVAEKLSEEMKKKERMMMSVRREKQTYSRIEWELKREAARIKKVISQSVRQKEKTYSFKGFRKGKGRLKWPVRGKVAIPFGKHDDPGLKTPVFRNGIYISAPEGQVTRAVGKGKVVFADWFEGYGQLVIINHGSGYHTLYGNLSDIFPSAGDIIKTNDKVGIVGASGVLNRAALYFEIRYKGKPLNPASWLAR